jgi:hypothetical protein
MKEDREKNSDALGRLALFTGSSEVGGGPGGALQVPQAGAHRPPHAPGPGAKRRRAPAGPATSQPTPKHTLFPSRPPPRRTHTCRAGHAAARGAQRAAGTLLLQGGRAAEGQDPAQGARAPGARTARRPQRSAARHGTAAGAQAAGALLQPWGSAQAEPRRAPAAPARPAHEASPPAPHPNPPPPANPPRSRTRWSWTCTTSAAPTSRRRWRGRARRTRLRRTPRWSAPSASSWTRWVGRSGQGGGLLGYRRICSRTWPGCRAGRPGPVRRPSPWRGLHGRARRHRRSSSSRSSRGAERALPPPPRSSPRRRTGPPPLLAPPPTRPGPPLPAPGTWR